MPRGASGPARPQKGGAALRPGSGDEVPEPSAEGEVTEAAVGVTWGDIRPGRSSCGQHRSAAVSGGVSLLAAVVVADRARQLGWRVRVCVE